jgi:hypothetical protein
MGAGKLRVLGMVAIGVSVMAGGCGRASSPVALVAGQVAGTAAPAAPTMTPSAAPVLGKLAFGPFLSTPDGTRALLLCENWAGLRAQYVARVAADTPYQLEQWFSSAAWRPAFVASRPLRGDPAYSQIAAAFGLATSGGSASIASASLLDKACAAAD